MNRACESNKKNSGSRRSRFAAHGLTRRDLLGGIVLTATAFGAPELRIVRAGVRQIEDGPEAGMSIAFVPGEVVFFSCQVEGYKVTDKKVSLAYTIEAVDPLGTPLIAPVSGKIEDAVLPEDKEWRPKIRQDVFLSPFAPGGDFKVRIKVEDLNAQTSAEQTVVYRVRGPEIGPADKLTVRNFRFYRGEDDVQPLEVVAYRPGDVVWARFDIGGHRFGEGNAIDVSYSIAVTAPDGKLLFQQAEPTVEKSASFYPRRFVSCLINLSLQPNIAPAGYTITVTAKDAIGNQEAKTAEVFRVE